MIQPQPNRSPIFLSASIPYGQRAQTYTPDPTAVREAVRALVAVVLPERPLVFGGHPAITPFVWEIAKNLGLAGRVFIYQSQLYQGLVPKEALFFNKLVWTRDVSGQRDQSLAHMRDLMIARRTDEAGTFVLPEYAAGVFVGGMDGVETEWDIFRQHYPTKLVFPVTSTEGAARLITQQTFRITAAPGIDPKTLIDLEHDLAYRRLFRRLLATIP